MANTIEKEKFKKRQKKINNCIFIGVLVILSYYMFHFFSVRSINKRLSLEDSFGEALMHMFTHPLELNLTFNSILLTFALVAFIIIARLFKQSDKEMRKHDNPDTVNGEAHLMNAEELDAYQTKMCDPIGKPGIDGPNNMILSKDIRLAIDGFNTRRNCNVLAIGGSGAGKSRFFAAPNILQYNTNFVITDPSGELLNDYAKALENAGYEILVFNIQDVYRSNRYNPFHYIKEEKDVFILVNTLIKNTTPPDSHAGDPIWENGEKLLLEAIILYLWHTAPEEKQTFDTVTQMINLAEIDENDASAKSPLDLLFDKLEEEDPDNLAVEQYKTFKLAAGKTLKSFLISVGTRLQTFKLSDIKYLTSTDDFHFETFADTKKALFVIIPTADTTFNFIVSMLYSQLFSSLYTYVETTVTYGWSAKLGKRNIIRVEQAEDKQESKKAKKRIEKFVSDCKKGTKKVWNEEKNYWEVYTNSGTLVGWRGTEEATDKFMAALPKLKIQKCERKCPYHVRFILDEFANIGQLPDFDQKLATIRKYEISCSIILQAISQLKDIYKDKWNTIAANCDTKLFLGCDDSETIEWLLKMLGKKTTTVENMSFQANGGGSTSYNKSSLEVMTIDQITMMQDDECLVRIRGVRPYYGKKYELTQHPNYKAASELKGQFEIPISEEAKKKRDRNRGPLRKRQKSQLFENTKSDAEEEITKSESKVEETSENSQKAPRKTKEDINKENQERKQKAEEEAKEAKRILDEADKSPEPPVLDEQMASNLLGCFGIDTTSTEEEIQEAVETMLELEHPAMDVITYGITN